MIFGAKWPKSRFLKKTLRPTIEYIDDQFLLQRCQQKRIEWGYNIFTHIVAKESVFRGTAGRQKLGYFSVMKYFGFINVNRAVALFRAFAKGTRSFFQSCLLKQFSDFIKGASLVVVGVLFVHFL